MAAVRVCTPVPDYSGSVGAVVFENGQATADTETHAAEIAYFESRGYSVEAADEAELDPADDADQDEEDDGDGGDDGGDDEEPVPQPAKNASTQAWRAWAVEHGGLSEEDSAAMTRDQLVERFADTEEN